MMRCYTYKLFLMTTNVPSLCVPFCCNVHQSIVCEEQFSCNIMTKTKQCLFIHSFCVVHYKQTKHASLFQVILDYRSEFESEVYLIGFVHFLQPETHFSRIFPVLLHPSLLSNKSWPFCLTKMSTTYCLQYLIESVFQSIQSLIYMAQIHYSGQFHMKGHAFMNTPSSNILTM